MEGLVQPFVEFGFMRRALAAALIVAVASAPLGVFLMQRRMSLVAESLVQGAMPGVAFALVFSGAGALAMTIGGFVSALVVAWGAALISRLTPQREDASLAAVHLIFFAAGASVIALTGNSSDVDAILFGRVLAIDVEALLVLASLASISVIVLALIYRPLVIDSFDPHFITTVGGSGVPVYFVFLGIVCAQLVAGIQAIGLLLMVGIMMLPATAARFWVTGLDAMIGVATVIALLSSYLGLIVSFYFDLPSGPAVICAAGLFYLTSAVAGPRNSMLASRHIGNPAS
jgi:zinc/manganese transport system permease protein